MKILSLILFLFLLTSCQSEEQKVIPQKKIQKSNYDFNAKSNSLNSSDDFSDLKKKDDESCDTEEEVTKKLAEPKQEAFQLQGGDSGCEVDAH